MNKKTFLIFGLLLLLFALPVMAQKEPARQDLSGTWVIRKPKTKKLDGITEKITLKLVINKIAKIDMPGKILPIKMASGYKTVFTKVVE
jgi:hypothetical protein